MFNFDVFFSTTTKDFSLICAPLERVESPLVCATLNFCTCVLLYEKCENLMYKIIWCFPVLCAICSYFLCKHQKQPGFPLVGKSLKKSGIRVQFLRHWKSKLGSIGNGSIRQGNVENFMLSKVWEITQNSFIQKVGYFKLFYINVRSFQSTFHVKLVGNTGIYVCTGQIVWKG